MIPESINDLSVIATNNTPQGGDNVGGTLDDILRAIQAIMKRDLALKKAETAEGTSFAPTANVLSENVQAALAELGDKVYAINWSSLSGKPDTATRWPEWSEITSQPSEFTPSSHTHPASQVTGLGTAATRNITASTAAPSGGNDGDIWLRYE